MNQPMAMWAGRFAGPPPPIISAENPADTAAEPNRRNLAGGAKPPEPSRPSQTAAEGTAASFRPVLGFHVFHGWVMCCQQCLSSCDKLASNMHSTTCCH